MTRLSDVCETIRSKNAGPFWVTLDLFFRNRDDFELYSRSEQLGQAAIGRIFGVGAELVKIFPVPSLNMMKISYARPQPQAWMGERDMHSGQQFVRLLDIEI